MPTDELVEDSTTPAVVMVNSREACHCNKCRGNTSHWVQTRNAHIRRHGLYEAPSSILISQQTASAEAPVDLQQEAVADRALFAPLDFSEIRNLILFDQVPPDDQRTICLDLRTFFHRNIGRPISEALMRDLLITLGDHVPVPRTLRGLQPKTLRKRVEKHVLTTTVCGVCFIDRLDDLTLFNSSSCRSCHQRKFHCRNLRCRSISIFRDSRAIRSTCSVCGVGPLFPKTKSAYYVQSVREVLEDLFGNKANALDLLEPFGNAGVLSWDGTLL